MPAYTRAQLTGENGHSFGVFDLVIDAMGLHSKLRNKRGTKCLQAQMHASHAILRLCGPLITLRCLRACTVDDPLGLHYEGAVLIHGMCEDPETTFPPDLMARFAPYGTIISASNGECHTLVPTNTLDSNCALTCS